MNKFKEISPEVSVPFQFAIGLSAVAVLFLGLSHLTNTHIVDAYLILFAMLAGGCFFLAGLGVIIPRFLRLLSIR